MYSAFECVIHLWHWGWCQTRFMAGELTGRVRPSSSKVSVAITGVSGEVSLQSHPYSVSPRCQQIHSYSFQKMGPGQNNSKAASLSSEYLFFWATYSKDRGSAKKPAEIQFALGGEKFKPYDELTAEMSWFIFKQHPITAGIQPASESLTRTSFC